MGVMNLLILKLAARVAGALLLSVGLPGCILMSKYDTSGYTRDESPLLSDMGIASPTEGACATCAQTVCGSDYNACLASVDCRQYVECVGPSGCSTEECLTSSDCSASEHDMTIVKSLVHCLVSYCGAACAR